LRQSQFRNDGDGPFRLEVPPGRYQLVVTAPSRAERRDTFLLETKHDVEVPLQGRDLTLPIVHGGRILTTITDRDGRCAGGSVTISGSAGKFTWSADRREPKDSPNLPAGTYELRFVHMQQRGNTVHQSTVEVRPCEVTDVRIRLP